MKGSGEPLATILEDKAQQAQLAAIFEQKQKAVPNPGAGSGIQAPLAAITPKQKLVFKSIGKNLTLQKSITHANAVAKK